MKKIKLTESQLNQLIENGGINEVTIEKISKDLIKSFNCGVERHSGGDFKDLIKDKVFDYGFKEVIVKFLKRDDAKNLYYMIYTSNIIFVITVESGIFDNKPCLSIIEVQPYTT